MLAEEKGEGQAAGERLLKAVFRHLHLFHSPPPAPAATTATAAVVAAAERGRPGVSRGRHEFKHRHLLKRCLEEVEPERGEGCWRASVGCKQGKAIGAVCVAQRYGQRRGYGVQDLMVQRCLERAGEGQGSLFVGGRAHIQQLRRRTCSLALGKHVEDAALQRGHKRRVLQGREQGRDLGPHLFVGALLAPVQKLRQRGAAAPPEYFPQVEPLHHLEHPLPDHRLHVGEP
mmetsp:Transcript_53921/g.100612  ORF Transcript_53921/g.100612 Transcript_53921/m.100612 type:complete len:230 (-) Transcript_53921:1904-2593(-)